MKKLTAFLFGLTLAISVGVLAQDSVIPSRMKLQALRVGAGAIPAAGNITATGTVTGATGTFTNLTAGGQNVCQANGTNCPAGTPVVVVVNRITSAQGLFSGSTDPVLWNNDVHDPNNLHDPVTNSDRILLPQGTGYAQCQATVTFFRGSGFSAATYYEHGIYINLNGNTLNGSWGSAKGYYSSIGTSGTFQQINVTSAVIPTSVATDYIQVRTMDNWGNSPTGPTITTDGANSATSTRASCWAVGR